MGDARHEGVVSSVDSGGQGMSGWADLCDACKLMRPHLLKFKLGTPLLFP